MTGECEGGSSRSYETFLPLRPQCLPPRPPNFLDAPQLPLYLHRKPLPRKGSSASLPPSSEHRTGSGAQAPLNGVSEEEPDPKVSSTHSLSVPPGRLQKEEQGWDRGNREERNRDREFKGPLRAPRSQVTKLVQGVGFPSF